MKNIEKISESEVEIMKLLWKKNPLTSKQIIDMLDGYMDWSDNTIKTFINRLLNKGAIRNERDGRSYLYYPVLTYDQYTKEENKSFLETVYDGSVGLLLSKFLESEELSNKEIEELKNILDERKSR